MQIKPFVILAFAACCQAAAFAAPVAVAQARPAGQEQVSPIFPEDGSMPLKCWYTYKGPGSNPAKTEAALAKEGIAVKDAGFDYEWIQDILFFAQDGKVLIQATDIPTGLLEKTASLTRGVFNNEDGHYVLTAYMPENAAGIDRNIRPLRWTVTEGGALITGRFLNGATYAIISKSVVDTAAEYYRYQTGKTISDEQAKALVAEDLGISPANVFPVAYYKHLDLVIFPLPDGRLLMHDPSKAVDTLRCVLASNPPAKEKARLKKMLTLYLKGFNGEKAIAPREQENIDELAAQLKDHFRIVRVAGIFREVRNYANSDMKYVGEYINFFNGFPARGQDGKLFAITNEAEGLTSLEAYWKSVLAKAGIDRVYFTGQYAYGAGLDCRGAQSPM